MLDFARPTAEGAPIRCSGSENPVLARSRRNSDQIPMAVQVVPDEHDRTAQLGVSDLQQVAVACPREALPAIRAPVRDRPIVSRDCSPGCSQIRAAIDRCRRSGPEPERSGCGRSGTTCGRSAASSTTRLVFRRPARHERRPSSSTLGQVSSIQPTTALSLRLTARRADT